MTQKNQFPKANIHYPQLCDKLADSPTGTKKDPPLTAFGIEQAREVAKYFKEDPVGSKEAPEMIFSSPY